MKIRGQILGKINFGMIWTWKAQISDVFQTICTVKLSFDVLPIAKKFNALSIFYVSVCLFPNLVSVVSNLSLDYDFI